MHLGDAAPDRSGGRRRTVCPVGAAFILVAFVSGAALPARAAPVELRVMSFNIRTANANDGVNDWDGNRKNLVEDTIRAFGPDLLGLQEALKRQNDFLEDKFPLYNRVGVGTEGGTNGAYSSLMYRRNKFEALDSGQFWLSETPDVVGSQSWNAAFPRVATWVHLRDKNDPSYSFVFMNTHWDHASSTARMNSATLIRGKIPDLASGLPFILTGDFNCDQGSDPYRRMTGRDDADNVRNLIDTYRELHPENSDTIGTAHGFDGRAGDGRIDWILHDSRFETLEASIVRTSYDGLYPSDHFPITAVIQPLPEPTSIVLLALGSSGALLRRVRRKG